jgi:hypothetical protein
MNLYLYKYGGFVTIFGYKWFYKARFHQGLTCGCSFYYVAMLLGNRSPDLPGFNDLHGFNDLNGPYEKDHQIMNSRLISSEEFHNYYSGSIKDFSCTFFYKRNAKGFGKSLVLDRIA